MIDYTQILIVNYPTAQWSLDGDYYDGLTWYSDTPKPTQTELDALWVTTQETLAKKSCKEQASALL